MSDVFDYLRNFLVKKALREGVAHSRATKSDPDEQSAIMSALATIESEARYSRARLRIEAAKTSRLETVATSEGLSRSALIENHAKLQDMSDETIAGLRNDREVCLARAGKAEGEKLASLKIASRGVREALVELEGADRLIGQGDTWALKFVEQTLLPLLAVNSRYSLRKALETILEDPRRLVDGELKARYKGPPKKKERRRRTTQPTREEVNEDRQVEPGATASSDDPRIGPSVDVLIHDGNPDTATDPDPHAPHAFDCDVRKTGDRRCDCGWETLDTPRPKVDPMEHHAVNCSARGPGGQDCDCPRAPKPLDDRRSRLTNSRANTPTPLTDKGDHAHAHNCDLRIMNAGICDCSQQGYAKSYDDVECESR